MDTILWDFDGVILNSNKVRDWGFEEIFKKYDNVLVQRLLNFHKENGGLSRYVKIRYFFEKILKQDISQANVQAYADKFSSLMRKELINPQNLISDAVNFIRKNYQNYNFHIVSGSDQEELCFLCQELKIDRYFISIHGSPTPKIELVKILLENYSYSLKNICLVGDSINDFEAAKENSIVFYGYNSEKLKKMDLPYIYSFDDFRFSG